MHTIKPVQVEGNLNNNAYSNMAQDGYNSSYSQSSRRSTGSRKNMEMFYGMEPGDLSKSSYARMKQNFSKEDAKLPTKVRSSAFRIDTGIKQSPGFQNAEKAFFLQSEPPSRGSRQINSREERLRNSRLAKAGGQMMMGQETESRAYKRAQKEFFQLPSSQATSQLASRPPSQHNVGAGDQMKHLNEITGGKVGGNARNSSKRFDTSASYKAAKKSFFLVDSHRSQARTDFAKSSSSVYNELPINKREFNQNKSTLKKSLHGIREEPTGFGKKAELFRNTMMTPKDRNTCGMEYDILTCSYRHKN